MKDKRVRKVAIVVKVVCYILQLNALKFSLERLILE
jgi:hypothetical protein